MPTEKRQRQKEGRAARQAALQAHRRKAARRRQVVTAVAVFAIVIIIVALLQRGDDGGQGVTAGSSTTTLGEGSPTSAPAPASKVGTAPCPPADGSATRTITFDGRPQPCIDPAKTYTATVETDVGTFTVALDAKKAPTTVNNFVFLARYHFFDGVKFHRVIPSFVIQGGDAAKGDGTGDAGYKIPDELPRQGEYKVGSLVMANSGQPNTGGSQFFVITGDQGVALPPQYSLFGQVTGGLEAVQKIEADGSPEGQPRTVHQMVKVTITEA
jgi:cyclophilin family peptidyl-prolyl cis-trans isomerase